MKFLFTITLLLNFWWPQTVWGQQTSTPIYALTQEEYNTLVAQAALLQAASDALNVPGTKASFRTTLQPLLQPLTTTPDTALNTLLVPVTVTTASTSAAPTTAVSPTVAATITTTVATTATAIATTSTATQANTNTTISTTNTPTALATTGTTTGTTTSTIATTETSILDTIGNAILSVFESTTVGNVGTAVLDAIESTVQATTTVASSTTTTTTTSTTTTTTSITTTTLAAAAALNYQITAQSLQQLTTDLKLVDVSALPVTALSPFVDTVFYQKDLLLLAFQMAGLPRIEPNTPEAALWGVLEKTTIPAELKAKAIQWPGNSCGCAQMVSSSDPSQTSTVGYYPYWLAGTAQAVDFHLYSRIEYFSHTLDQTNQIQSPLNWNASAPYSDFIDRAQQYRVKLDAVISNEGWSAQSKAFDDDLIQQITALVQAPRTDDLLNRLKPILSFGQSPARTMADGVTLHLSLGSLTTQDQANFTAFIPNLKQALSGSTQAHSDDAYYLNVMVPAHTLLNSKRPGFYTLTNLMAIEPSVNLFILTLDLPERYDSTVPAPEDLMKQLRSLLDNSSNTSQANALLQKIVPLITPGSLSATELQNNFTYANWNFSGFGLWSLPLTTAVSSVVTTTLEGDSASTSLLPAWIETTAVGVCNIVCPQRWVIRAALFVGAFLLLGYWGLCPCGSSYRWLSQLFFGLSVVLPLTFLLALMCDPYWQQQQGVVLFVFFSIGLLVVIFRNLQKKRAAKFP